MARLSLRRVVRSHRGAIDAAAALVPSVAIVDPTGRVLLGGSDEAPVHPITHEGTEVGVVRGPEGAAQIAALLSHLYAAEAQKRALAEETLGRYKELSLLYDMSDALSHVLDVEEVAAMVVEQAHRALGAESSALFLHDVASGTLDPIATRSDLGTAVGARAADHGLEGRVLAQGRAELVETDQGGAAMCAPMRSGEQVFGVLCVQHRDSQHWAAGDLKLLSSMAAYSAAAISHARIHADQLRREALRGRIERFLSPHLADAALAHRDLADAGAVIFVDVGGVASASEKPDVVLHLATALALEVLMQCDATVDASSGEMLVGVFADADGFVTSAERATQAAVAILGAFDLRFGGPFASVPGIGVARAALDESVPREALVSGVGVAATLQALSRGRVLVDRRVAAAVTELFVTEPADPYEDREGSAQAYEVRL